MSMLTPTTPSTILRLQHGLDPSWSIRRAGPRPEARPALSKCKCRRRRDYGFFTARESAILKGAALFEPGGCPECGDTGYRGRRGIYEALVVTDELEDLIAKKASVVDLRDLAMKQGMTTLRESGLGVAARGETSLDEVLANTVGEAP
jgi:type II secretory ATPase GspE/PulE/Tfp pilus assembly ATPase PilB-like protein